MTIETIYYAGLNLISYDTFQWFFAIVFSVICLSSMIINNLTARKWLSLIILTVLGMVLFIFALRLLELTVPDVIVDQHIYALIVIFGATMSIAYTAARIGIIVSVHPRKRIALLLAKLFRRVSQRAVKVATFFVLKADNLDEYATIPAVERGEALVRRAQEMRAKLID